MLRFYSYEAILEKVRERACGPTKNSSPFLEAKVFLPF